MSADPPVAVDVDLAEELLPDLDRQHLDHTWRHLVRQALVEGPIVPEIGLGTTNAGVPALDGETDPVVPFDHSAGIVGIGTFAPHLVETIPFFGIVVIERFHEEPCIVIGPSVAGIVYPCGIKGFGSSQGIQLRDPVKGQNVHQ